MKKIAWKGKFSFYHGKYNITINLNTIFLCEIYHDGLTWNKICSNTDKENSKR